MRDFLARLLVGPDREPVPVRPGTHTLRAAAWRRLRRGTRPVVDAEPGQGAGRAGPGAGKFVIELAPRAPGDVKLTVDLTK